MGRVGHVARMDEGRRAFKILTGKPTGKRPLGRPTRRWEDNIRMYREEISCECSIEPPGSISHGVSLLLLLLLLLLLILLLYF